MPIENFLGKCRQVMRLKRLSYRTEKTYLLTVRRFIVFHSGRIHPKDMGAEEIRAYLSHLLRRYRRLMAAARPPQTRARGTGR